MSNAEFGIGSNPDLSHAIPGSGSTTKIPIPRSPIMPGSELVGDGAATSRVKHSAEAQTTGGDAVEIWDMRRGWIAKWSVSGSAMDGGVTG